VTDNEDPGWRPSLRTLLLAMVPGMRSRIAHKDPGLTALRSVFLSFCTVLVVFGIVVPIIIPFTGHGSDAAVWASLLVVLGVIVYAAEPQIEKRSPLKCDNLAGSYRARFFLRAAFSESLALFGFAWAFVANAAWIYFVGLALTAIGFVRAAPTRAALERDQQQLAAQGCGESLVAALNRPPYTR
jgi:hypothetical protein